MSRASKQALRTRSTGGLCDGDGAAGWIVIRVVWIKSFNKSFLGNVCGGVIVM